MIKNAVALIYKNPEYSMPALILVWGSLYILFGAVINVNNGLGYDGAIYGYIIKFFDDLISNDKLSYYRIQRVFPPFLINLFLTITKLPKEDFLIVKAFQLYNLTLLVICSFLWHRIAGIYGLDLKFIWLGFVLAFLNFGIAEHTFFYPVLTDTTAFFLGFCLLYFHLKDNITGKIFIVIIGAFTWPTLMYFGILVILFPVKSVLDLSLNHTDGKKTLQYIIALLVPLYFLIISTFEIRRYFNTGELRVVRAPFFPDLLYLDALLNYSLMVYFFVVMLPAGFTFSNSFNFFKSIFKSLKVKNVFIGFFLLIVIYFIQTHLSGSSIENESSFKFILYSIALYSITKPIVYFVNAVSYFGPAFVVLFFYMKYFKNRIMSLGTGVYISFIITIILIFNTESRMVINFYPFIVLFTVLVLRDFDVGKKIFFSVAVFSIILSKIYIPMLNVPGEESSYFTFHDQLYFMNTYLISYISYYILSVIVFVISVFFILAIKKIKPFKVILK